MGFAVDQQPEPGGELQLGVAVGMLELVGQGVGHPGQAQVVQLLQGLVDQHGVLQVLRRGLAVVGGAAQPGVLAWRVVVGLV
ncbi:hypothetical protein GCM10023321_08340 [Pseudonocardia eucalypti]|uniref:Uncharacterized protein n=1 Tax=Pseudonocardia eucalypti TaxID=648755 RepID=A0ABP9PJ79_9PSEU